MLGLTLKTIALDSRTGDAAQIHETIDTSLEHQTSAIGSLLENQLVNENAFLKKIAAQFQLPWWDVSIPGMDDKLRQQFPARLALRYCVYPVRFEDHGLFLLTYDPFDLTARQVIAHDLAEPITWCVASRRNVLAALRTGYGVGAATFDEILEGRDDDDAAFDLQQEVNVVDEDPEASVVSFVNQIKREALG